MGTAGSTFGGAASGAATGAMIGSVGGPVGTAIGAGAGALVGGLSGYFGSRGDSEAEAIAKEQMAEAQRTRQLAMRSAAPSEAELRLLGQELDNLNEYQAFHQKEIARAEKILGAVNPAIIESSNQALALMKGQEAAILNPLKRQRAEAKYNMEAQLRDAMGEGFSGSTAGAQAMRRFDLESGDLLTNAQFQALNHMTGVSQAYAGIGAQTSAGAREGYQLRGALSGNLLGAYGNIANRTINAINATPTTQYAGADHTAEYLGGLRGEKMMGDLLSAGTSLATMKMYTSALGAKGAGGGTTTDAYEMGPLGDYPVGPA